jgi:hypothetical protein
LNVAGTRALIQIDSLAITNPLGHRARARKKDPMHFNGLRRLGLAVVILGSSLPGAAPALASSDADAVIAWNLNASNAIVGVARQPPHSAIFSFAMVQGAVYDAVTAIEGGYEPYLSSPDADGTESTDAAVATAAYAVLVTLFPAQQLALDSLYAASLADVPDGTAKEAGIDIGEATASVMIADRAGDGRAGPPAIVIGDEPGEWRPTLPLFGTDPASWAGNVRPFLMDSVDQFRSDGPNPMASAAYAEDLNEVKSLGASNSSTRTADQTDAAIFWQDHGVALWNRIQRSLATSHALSGAEAARLLAGTNLAGADGAISCWNDKVYWNFWRPITAIREAGSDGNSATEADGNWTPLFGTPPFPDHPSGHGCVSGAIVHTMQNFFGTDKIGFTAFSNNSLTTRSFDRLSHALKEIIDCRVWAGIHFRTADVQGAVIGKKVAHLLDASYLQPMD